MAKRLSRNPTVIILALALMALAVLALWCRAQLRPLADAGELKIIQVERGEGASVVARKLAAEGLIRSAPAFEIYLAWTRLGTKLKAGYYDLSPAMSGQEMAERIASGRVTTRKVTVPEGLRLAQVAERVAASGLATADGFLAAAVPGTVAGKVDMPLPEGTLEGYLLPETYEFALGTTADDIVLRMVRELQDRFVKPNAEAIGASALSLHQIVTLASLVEREARVPEDRPKIAGVLINRLDRGMKLQCDATVQYALGEHKQRLTFQDLKVDSPYNTYLHKGLPPGPIACPGLASLQAALHPARTDALFYVAKPDGSHVFSRTYEEHQAAIRKIRGQ